MNQFMVAFELIKCFAPAAAANLFFHSLFSLRMGRVIEREIAALAAPKGTVQRKQLMNEFELFFSFVVGYRRLAAIMLRKKEKTKTIQMK